MSHKRYLAILVTLLLISSVIFTASITAQTDDNLLTDPGFESTSMKTVATSQGEGITFSVNVDWDGWYSETPRNEDWQNRTPNGTGRNNAGFGFVRSGNRSMELSRGFSTFTAAIYQTVTVPENADVTGSAWVVMNISGENADQANSRARVGIDPTGGTNPLSAGVVWSPTVTNALASNGFREMTVNATAQGTQVTLFLYATQSVPTEGNGVFWDDASLTVGGPGGTSPAGTAAPTGTPVPTAPPVVAFVNPQAPRDDGSIVHVVQEGDTLASIAVAYDVSMDEVRELNPEIGQGRFLRIGQELLIRRASALNAEGPGPSGPIEAPTTQAEETTDEAPTQAEETTDEAPTQVAQALPEQQPAPSLPDIRVSTVYFFANDLAAMQDFYTDIIGLEETMFTDDEESGMLVYDGGAVDIVFLEATEALPTFEEWMRQPNYDGGTIEESSLVITATGEEFDAIVSRVVNDGIEAYQNSIIVPEVGQRAIFVRDPMGNTVQILTQDG